MWKIFLPSARHHFERLSSLFFIRTSSCKIPHSTSTDVIQVGKRCWLSHVTILDHGTTGSSYGPIIAFFLRVVFVIDGTPEWNLALLQASSFKFNTWPQNFSNKNHFFSNFFCDPWAAFGVGNLTETGVRQPENDRGMQRQPGVWRT